MVGRHRKTEKLDSNKDGGEAALKQKNCSSVLLKLGVAVPSSDTVSVGTERTDGKKVNALRVKDDSERRDKPRTKVTNTTERSGPRKGRHSRMFNDSYCKRGMASHV